MIQPGLPPLPQSLLPRKAGSPAHVLNLAQKETLKCVIGAGYGANR